MLFGPDIFSWGGGPPREGVGAQKFGMSFETQRSKTFGGISRNFAGISRRCPKSSRKKSLCLIFSSPILSLQGHSGTKVRCESCLFSQGKTPEFTNMGEIHELFVLPFSLAWFAGATPEFYCAYHPGFPESLSKAQRGKSKDFPGKCLFFVWKRSFLRSLKKAVAVFGILSRVPEENAPKSVGVFFARRFSQDVLNEISETSHPPQQCLQSTQSCSGIA